MGVVGGVEGWEGVVDRGGFVAETGAVAVALRGVGTVVVADSAAG